MTRPTAVLCVHPDAAVRRELTAALSGPETSVESAADAATALDRLAAVDCVVAGRLPDGDGLGLVRTVRERRPALPVVLFPGDGDEAFASEAFAAGATDYVPRDGAASYDELAARVAAATERRSDRADEQFRALIEHSTDMISILGPEGRFEYVSPSTERVLGHAPGDLLGENAFDYVHPDDLDDVSGKFFAAVDDDDYRPVAEFRFRDGDGEWRVIEARGKNRLDDPAVEGFVVNARDVTERKERERELRTERALTEGILDTIPDTVYAFDPDGDPVREDLTLAAVPGYTEAELRERHPLEFVPEADRDRVAAAIASVLEEGGVETVESALVSKDGERVPHEFNGARLTDEEGTVLGLVGTARDISERKRREQELELYETMVETAGDGVYAMDAEGRYLAVNDRIVELSGYAREELLGRRPPSDLLPESAVDRFESVIAELLTDDRRVATVEHPVHTRAGETRHCETRLTLLPSEDGTFRGTVGSTRDITERVERARERERQNERLEAFASVVSHDLRNPLNVITGNVELARRTGELAHLDAVESAADQMDALISDLLSLARQGQTIGEVEPVDVGQAAEEAWATVDTGQATLALRHSGTVLADGGRLGELFQNLFRNAVEHGSTSPRSQAREDAVEHGSTGPRPSDEDAAEHGTADVTVEVGPLADGRGFYVADDGPGIPEDERDRVLDHGYTTSEDGTGLGLAIVCSIVEAHGWALAVTESEAAGARFEVSGVERPDRDSEDDPGRTAARS